MTLKGEKPAHKKVKEEEKMKRPIDELGKTSITIPSLVFQ